MPRFKEVVNSAWNQEVNHVDPYHILFHKMKKTSQVLRKWSKTIFAHSKVQIHMALEVILRLDVAQECRPLSAEELDIRRRLKRKVISLSVLERARKRQCSRITNLKVGDANTYFFISASIVEEERISFTASSTIVDGSLIMITRSPSSKTTSSR